MNLTRKNLLDSANCVGKNCLECSMLSEKSVCLDGCIAMVAKAALELMEEREHFRREIFKLIGNLEVKGVTDNEQRFPPYK